MAAPLPIVPETEEERSNFRANLSMAPENADDWKTRSEVLAYCCEFPTGIELPVAAP